MSEEEARIIESEKYTGGKKVRVRQDSAQKAKSGGMKFREVEGSLLPFI